MFKVMAHFQVSLSGESKPSVINIVKMCTNQTLFGSGWAARKQVGGGDLRHELYKNEETLENSLKYCNGQVSKSTFKRPKWSESDHSQKLQGFFAGKTI